MRRFIENVRIRSLAIQHTVDPEHLVIFKNLMGPRSLGSATDTLFEETTFLASSFTNLTSLQDIVSVTLLSPSVLYTFDSVKVSYLRI